jgi:hypothetical protein
MHLQDTSAFDTADPDKVYVVNQPAPNAYTATADIETLTVDSDNDPLSNKYYNLVIWHSVSSGSEEEKVFINLPSGSYTKQGDATSDVSGYDNYSIPSGFRGYGFLVQRVTIKHSTGGGGTWTIIQETDLRGSVPTVAVGSGTASITTEFADSQFKLFDEGDPTREVAFQLSGIAESTTRTLTVQDADGTLALTSDLHDAVTIHADAAHALSTQELQAVLAANGQTGHMSGAMFDKLAAIEAAADVTDATNVAAAGAVMDSDISPGEGFLRKTGAGGYTAHKSNLGAAAAPDANEDTADGYSVGSVWIDTTNDNMYICVDATEAAAVWLHLNAAAADHDHTGGGDGGVLTNDQHDGYSLYDEIADPGAPAANKLRVYAIDVGGTTGLQITDSAGVDTTIVARTRKVPMSFTAEVHNLGGHLGGFGDGSTHDVISSIPIPSDWVAGTDITVNIMLYKAGVNAEDAVFASFISAKSEGETVGWNVESSGNYIFAVPASSEIVKLSRTIDAASISAGEVIEWNIQRIGAHASDTLDETLFMAYGPWIEYTAFF